MGSTGLNPLPQSPRIVNPDGSPTQEFYWFLLALFNVTQSSESIANNPFTPPVTPAGDDPTVQAIERLQSFVSPAATQASTTASQLQALLRQLAFGPPTNDALQRIRALEVKSAFQPQTSGVQVVTEADIANAEWLLNVAGTNTVTAATETIYTELAPGFLVRFIPAHTNTGALTLNVNGIGAEPVTLNGTTALVGGELVIGQAYLLLWDGTEWQIIGPIVAESTLANAEWLTVGGTANAITGTTAVKYSALAAGFVVRLVPTATNTNTVTLNVNGIGAKAVTKFGATALSGGELVNGTGYVLLYDGTQFQIIGTFAVTEAMVAAAEWLTGVAGTNTITGATATPYASLSAGFVARLIPANTNSGATTLNVNGIGASPVTKNGTTALSGGELVAGQVCFLLWDGAEWQILSQASTPFTPTAFTPLIQIGGSAIGISSTFTATSSKTGTGPGAPVTVVLNITITAWPALPSGTVTIGNLPVTAGANSVGAFEAVSGFIGLSAGVSVIPALAGTTITLDTQGTTGLTALPAATIGVGSVFTITLAYQSA